MRHISKSYVNLQSINQTFLEPFLFKKCSKLRNAVLEQYQARYHYTRLISFGNNDKHELLLTRRLWKKQKKTKFITYLRFHKSLRKKYNHLT